MKYCESIYQTKRRPTREVKVGGVGIGGRNPIRIQSMTTSPTDDVAATVEQIERLTDAGCELVRVTVQGIKEVQACEKIKNSLIQRGVKTPLVADIHFFPKAAMEVADFVDKVRINPGNFVDKRAQFKVIEYDDALYAKELERIEEKFAPLVQKCKRLKRAMRIGTNHGSLSDRIMNRFGDTPKGMVESALEFAEVCRKYDYHEFLFSMKASNPKVMIEAYRLLTAEMYRLGWDYPLHLGVTEAGEGEDGRIKSAMGIGALLLDGLGDTIRVSLTEDPWKEVAPCRALVSLAKKAENKGVKSFEEHYRTLSGAAVPTLRTVQKEGLLFLSLSEKETTDPTLERQLGTQKMDRVDGVIVEGKLTALPQVTCVSPKEIFWIESDSWDDLEKANPKMVVLSLDGGSIHRARLFFEWMCKKKLHIPLILKGTYKGIPEEVTIQAGAELGSLLCEGIGDGLLLETEGTVDERRLMGLRILQAARKRIFKTEFVSCPGCGRTLFDLQEVSAEIRKRTEHLPGVRIAIMGCIVNGPGEMADADFGYVGSGPGKIDLYVGKECVKKAIPMAEGADRLVALLKEHDAWVEP